MSVKLLTPETDCPIYQSEEDPGERINPPDLLDLIHEDQTDVIDLRDTQETSSISTATLDQPGSPLEEPLRTAEKLGVVVNKKQLAVVAEEAGIARSWLKVHCGNCALQGTCETNKDLRTIIDAETEVADTLEKKNEAVKPIVRLSEVFGRWDSAQDKIASRTRDKATNIALIKQANELQHTFTEEVLELANTQERDRLIERIYKRIGGKQRGSFHEFISGVVCEAVVHDILQKIGDIKGWDVKKANAEQDIFEGTDSLITTPDGRTVRVDAKSRNAFRKMSHGSDEDEYVDIKNVTVQEGKLASVIVINPEGSSNKRSAIGTNCFSATGNYGKEPVTLPSFSHVDQPDNVRALCKSIIRVV